MPPLADHLAASLAALPGTRSLNLHVLVSVPRKCGTLFPHADKNAAPKVYIQDVLILLSEDAHIDQGDEKHPVIGVSSKARFVSAIEANMFTIPSTSSSLLYICKVDATGQGQAPSPTQTLLRSFLSYCIDPANRRTDTLWVHVFARAQNQYLFPNSVEHPSKRVLTDAQLCSWWKRLLGTVAQTQSNPPPQLYHVIPGFSELEALQLLRQMNTSATTEHPSTRWIYGDPYSQGRDKFPFGVLRSPSIAEVIPCFQDDPKSRFLDELFAPSKRLLRSKSPPRKRVKTAHGEHDSPEGSSTSRDHPPPPNIATVPEFWEMMGFRQECISGAMTGFFVLIFDKDEKEGKEVTAGKSYTHPLPEPGQVSHNIIDRTIRSMLTSHEFSTDQRSFTSTEVLETSVRNLCQGLKEPNSEAPDPTAKTSEEHADVTSLELYHKYIHRTVKTSNPPLVNAPTEPASEGGSLAPQPVTMLTVKKKKKKS